MKIFRLTPLLALLFAPAAHADLNSGDTAWILTSSALVLLMTLPGLALFYAGLVRFKNVISVITKSFALASLMSILWVAIGYSLAFSGNGAYIGDLGRVMLRGIAPDTLSGSIPETVFAVFQMTFAVITPALIIGAYVERIRFSAIMLFSGIWLLVVYAPVTHWIWGGGFLAEEGVLDFAGGLVVHATAGVTAIVLVKRIGNRDQFPVVEGSSSPLIAAIGAALLWVGWFGFNGGSALAADGSAGMAILVTHIAASAGTLVWVALERIKNGKYSLVAAITGTIAGLATITPASGFVGVPGGFVLGIVGGVVCYYAVPIIRSRLKIDDSLDVFAVHGVGGILGALLVAFLASERFGGLGLPDGMWSQFIVQAKGTVIVIVWSVGVSWILAWAVNKVLPLRAPPDKEADGLDDSYHGEHSFYW